MSALGEQESRIKVAVRSRPLHPERERYDNKCVKKMNETDIVIASGEKTSGRQETVAYSFDYAFDEDDQQLDVYNESVLDLVDATLDGHNATVLAYGQTGSGKTFTMLGEVDESGASLLKSNSGLFLRVLTDLFLYKQRCTGHMHVMITLSIIEIYVQEVRDLLNNKKVIKMQLAGDDVRMTDLKVVPVHNLRDVMTFFKIADKQRVAKKTAMNDVSSRSHALFMIDLFQQAKTPQSPELPDFGILQDVLHGIKDGDKFEVPLTKSRICLVDLAGSERIGRSQVEGQMRTEAIAINKSLTVLGTVVTGLHKSNKHINYRDSALTLALKSVFTDPNCKVLLCANLSPAHTSYSETKSTLTFANQVKSIKVSSVSVDPQAEIEYLEKLKKLEELCGDLRIATVLHEFILQTPSGIRHVPLDKEGARASLLKEVIADYQKEVTKRKAIKAQQEEEEIHRLAKEIAQQQISELQGKQAELQKKIDETNKLNEQLEKDIVKAEAEKKGEIEVKTQEAKKIRKQRREAEEKIAKLNDENNALETEIQSLALAVSNKGEDASGNLGGPTTKEEDDAAHKAEQYHACVQDIHDKVMHLRNHQVDYLRIKTKAAVLKAEQDKEPMIRDIVYPFIGDMVNWMVSRATRISSGQASYHDGETCEHLTRLLPLESWPHALSLQRMALPHDDGEEVIDAPCESDYETADEASSASSRADVQDDVAVYNAAAASIGVTPAALGENAQPIQYDFVSAKKKKVEDDQRRREEEARHRQKMAQRALPRDMASDVTKPYDNDEADKTYLMSIYDQDHLITDLLVYLESGTLLIKHGRKGKPHKRRFWIDMSTKELCWSDEPGETPSGKGKRSVVLSNVTSIILGMYSKVFKRNKVTPATDGFYRAFTIVVKGGKRTIDVVAESVSDYEAWLIGLSSLLHVEPVWGDVLDVSTLPDGAKESEGFRKLAPSEQDALKKHHIQPSLLLSLKKTVTDKRDEVVAKKKLFRGDMSQVYQAIGGIHPPKLNTENALLVTKGELRYYSDTDIFRTCVMWKLFEEDKLIFDPNFKLPA
ncbi:Kinesin-like protein KIN-1 [Diplonema papillatum]|nr:Kinesin-like protein KIN-1 [Diplonema papillatum]